MTKGGDTLDTGIEDSENPKNELPTISDRGGFLVRRLNQIWSGLLQRRFREAGYNVTSVQFAALEMISQCGGLDQTDLALRLGYDRATTGGMISRLERDEHVARVAHPTDKRARLVIATAKGRSAAAELGKIARRADAEFLNPLAAQDKDALFTLMKRLVNEAEHFDVAPAFRLTGRSARVAPDE